MMQPIDNFVRRFAWPAASLILILTAITDARTGYQFSLLAFYFFPVALLAWYRGLRAGLLMSIMAATTWLLCDYQNGHQYVHEGIRYWNALMRWVVFSIFSISYASLRKAMTAREMIIAELQTALNQVKTLSGYLPACPSCQRIRVESGAWQDLELYVREQSRIEFVSVVCPHCVGVHLPESEKGGRP